MFEIPDLLSFGESSNFRSEIRGVAEARSIPSCTFLLLGVVNLVAVFEH